MPGSRTISSPLNRRLILEKAIQLLDRDGLQGLTMRKLGDLLEVEAMAIYHYYNGREDLLDAIVDHLVAGVRLEPGSVVGERDGWQPYVQALARRVRQMALDHPQAFPLVATRHPAAPWLRPPLRSLDLAEDLLAAMRARGLTRPQAVHIYRVVTGFLLGHLMLEASTKAQTLVPDESLGQGDPAAAPDPEHRSSANAGPGTRPHPTIDDLEPLLRNHDPDVEFDASLEGLLDRLERELTQTGLLHG